MMKKITLAAMLLLFIKAHSQGTSVATAEPFCSGGAELVFNNITGSPNTTIVGCLGSIPNAAYYYLEIDRPGDLVFTISQVDNAGNPIDVDFITWGPFASVAAADAAINLAPCTPTACPNNTDLTNPNFYPYTTDDIVDCSYDPAPIENMTITGAQTGEIYIVLITNFADVAGSISFQQTYGNGSTSCSGIPVCGSGFYDTGGDTGSYSNNEVNDTTTIFPDVAGGVVTVTFNSFDLADAGDTLAVYDGDTTAGTLLGTFTGTTTPGPFTSSDPSGALTFVFNSNASGVGTGWDADVTCTEPPTPPVCGTTFTDSGGAGGDYGNDEYEITTFYPDTAGEVVTVDFTSFDVEPPFFLFGVLIWYDYIEVYDGPNTLAGTLIGRFAGTDLASSSFTSTHASGALTFLFVSDSSLPYAGWTANVTCSPPTSNCGTTFVDSGGAGGNYSNDEFQFYTFYPDSAGDVITATFNSFSVENTWDYLYVFDGPNQFATQIGAYTGTTIPASFTSTHATGALTFVFLSDGSNTSTGWDADITCSNPSSTCGTVFYDDGGPSLSYTNNQNTTTTFAPDNLGEAVTATFTQFHTRNANDYLEVFDGPDASSPSLGIYFGNLNAALPGPFTSSHPSGELTFVFISDANQRRAGWAANITCGIPPCDLVIRDIVNGASCSPNYTQLTVRDNVVFSETFDGPGTPSGWTISNGRNNTQWFVDNTSDAGGDPNEFILAYLNGNRFRNDTWTLTSQSMNINGYTNLALSYYQFLEDFDYANYPYSIFVETSVDSGPWVTQSSNTPTGDVGPNVPTIDLSGITGNTLQVRFRMTGMPYGFLYWAIDNVLVTGDGAPSGAPITWSPTAGLFTDSSLSTPYAGGNTDTVYAAPGNQTYTATDGSSGCSDSIVLAIVGKTWVGGDTTVPNTNPNDWMNAGNWSDNLVPTSTDCVIIPATANNPILYTNDNGDGLNLSILTGATLTIQTDASLTIQDFVNTQGTFQLNDSASLIQVNDVVNTGSITLDRTANIRRTDYVYWSSPTANFDISNISPNTPAGAILSWNPSFDRPDGPPPTSVSNDYGIWEVASGIMSLGKGYILRGPTGHPETPTNYTATFTGVPNNGNIVENIICGINYSENYFDQSGTQITPDDDNWNLIGNPYPSAISAVDFLTTNTSIDGVVYLWSHGTQINTGSADPFYDDYVYNYEVADYIAYNRTGPSTQNGFDGYIGSGQGFFVLMNDLAVPTAPTSSATVTFNNTMRQLTPTYDNSQFYRLGSQENTTNDNIEKHRIWLDMISPSGVTNTTLIGYVDGATNERDRLFDAVTTAGSGFDLYSLINGKEFLIQGKQTPFEDTDTVPLGVNLTETGIYTIAINGLDGLFASNQQIYIEDLELNIIHNVKNSPYTFTVDNIDKVDTRFVLRYTDNTLSIDNPDALDGLTIIAPSGKYISIESTTSPIQDVKVYDLLGRVVINEINVNIDELTIETKHLANSAYIVKVTLLNDQQKIQKVVLNQ